MSKKRRPVKRYPELENRNRNEIQPVQPHNYNVMPDGMLEAISATDLAILAIAKDAPRIPEDHPHNRNR
ncbi:hypothetical protein [Alkaliphilus transvaalensis]|uniref:hypothetical protein n=1 Tax=Alkaliphilus transvaalensis TaxID=114628 RepID=UPI00047DC68D|nr:hypothetical protein [Alkaliphilus transvaalensis]